MYYAINTIELAKGQDFEDFPEAGNNKFEGIEGLEDGNVVDGKGNATPFYRTVTVKDYAEMDGNIDKKAEVLKRVTVIISYKYKDENKTVELSTVVSREV